MALLHGVNPVDYGYMTHSERQWFNAVLQKAVDRHLEEQKAIVEAIGVAVGNAVSRHLAKLFG